MDTFEAAGEISSICNSYRISTELNRIATWCGYFSASQVKFHCSKHWLYIGLGETKEIEERINKWNLEVLKGEKN
jgi:hypothetical protein